MCELAAATNGLVGSTWQWGFCFVSARLQSLLWGLGVFAPPPPASTWDLNVPRHRLLNIMVPIRQLYTPPPTFETSHLRSPIPECRGNRMAHAAGTSFTHHMLRTLCFEPLQYYRTTLLTTKKQKLPNENESAWTIKAPHELRLTECRATGLE